MKTLRKITKAELKNLEIQATNHDTCKDVLINFHKAMLAGRIYIINKQSKSCLSSKLSVHYVHNNQLLSAPSAVYKMMGCNVNGLIHGGGMDMAFAALHNYQCETLTPRQMKKYYDLPSYNSLYVM